MAGTGVDLARYEFYIILPQQWCNCYLVVCKFEGVVEYLDGPGLLVRRVERQHGQPGRRVREQYVVSILV